MTSVVCARCGSDSCEAHVTAYGVDPLPEIWNERLQLAAQTIETPDSVQVEAVCRSCGHVRYLNHTEWEWA